MGTRDGGLACLVDEVSNLYTSPAAPDPQFILVLLYLAHCSEVRDAILYFCTPDVGLVGPYSPLP